MQAIYNIVSVEKGNIRDIMAAWDTTVGEQMRGLTASSLLLLSVLLGIDMSVKQNTRTLRYEKPDRSDMAMKLQMRIQHILDTVSGDEEEGEEGEEEEQGEIDPDTDPSDNGDDKDVGKGGSNLKLADSMDNTASMLVTSNMGCCLIFLPFRRSNA